MYKYFILLIALTFISCKKTAEEVMTTNVDVVFKVKYQGAPVVFLTPHIYAAGQNILFQKIDFYLSSIALRKTGSLEKTELKSIDFIDFSNTLNTIGDSQDGLRYTLSNVPTGDYSSITFNVGVGQEYNATQPSDYSSSHPLSRTDHFWPAWNTYIFSKLEGKFDSDNDGDFETSFSYHTGTDAMLQDVSLLKTFTVETDKSLVLNIDIDLYDIFVQGTQQFDILEHPTTHNPIDSMYGHFISNGFKNAISIE